MFLGVDIGGTFTDLVLLDEEGELITTKALSTPGELEVGVFNAVQNAAEQKGMTGEELLAKVTAFGHGTTQATNAVIERTGARTGLLATAGLWRHARHSATDGLHRGSAERPARLVLETAAIRSRLSRAAWCARSASASIIPAACLRRSTRQRVAAPCANCSTLASRLSQSLSFGHSTIRNTSGSRRRIIREMAPNAYVSLSSDVAPVIGEYERTATAALNSYLAPKVVSYLDGIEQMLRKRGFKGAFSILNSAGGVMPVADAARRPVTLVTSGPTGGVMGSVQLAKQLGIQEHHHDRYGRHVLRRGDRRSTTSRLCRPIMKPAAFISPTPMIEVRAIGAGGGSIARAHRRTAQGRSRKRRRAARPRLLWARGQGCHGHGRRRRARHHRSRYFPRRKNEARPRRSGERRSGEQIARPARNRRRRKPRPAFAASSTRKMADTLREVTIGRGHDPRDFVLFAYGGAGPVHCAGYGVGARRARDRRSGYVDGAFRLRRARRGRAVFRRTVPADARRRGTAAALAGPRSRSDRGGVSAAGGASVAHAMARAGVASRGRRNSAAYGRSAIPSPDERPDDRDAGTAGDRNRR